MGWLALFHKKIRQLLQISFLEIIANILMLTIPFGAKFLIDEGRGFTNVFWITIGLVACIFVRAAINILKDRLVAVCVEEVIWSLRRDMFASFLGNPQVAIKRFSWGEIMCMFSEDVQKLRMGIYYKWFPMLHSCILFFFVAIALWVLSIFIFVYGMVFVLIISTLYAMFYPKLYDIFSSLRSQISKTTDVLVGLLSGWDMITVYNLKDKVLQRYCDISSSIACGYVRSAGYTSLLMGLSDLVLSLGLILVLALGLFFSAEGRVSLGQIIAGYVLLSMMVKPMIGISSFFSSKEEIKSSWERISLLLDVAKRKELDISNGESIINTIETVELRNVSFSYEKNSVSVFQDLSCKFGRGDLVLVVGGNGSGKTTLLRLISGLYFPSEGEILINGERFCNINRNAFFSRVGVVFCSDFFIRGSIYENLLLSGEEDEERARQLLDHFDLPFPLDMELEEMGRNISAGQRQRLSLVRALLRSPNMLVLDEVFANVDTEGCNKMLKFIVGFSKKGGVVVLASNKWINKLRAVSTVVINLDE